MTQQEITAGNVQISRMMELMHMPNWAYDPISPRPLILRTDRLRYHEDWNWLMAALLKMKGMMPPRHLSEDEAERFGTRHAAIWEDMWEMLPTCNISIVWASVVEFAGWYNLINQPQGANGEE